MSTLNIHFCGEIRKTSIFFGEPKHLRFFLFLHKNIRCGYSLEAPYLLIWLGSLQVIYM